MKNRKKFEWRLMELKFDKTGHVPYYEMLQQVDSGTDELSVFHYLAFLKVSFGVYQACHNKKRGLEEFQNKSFDEFMKSFWSVQPNK